MKVDKTQRGALLNELVDWPWHVQFNQTDSGSHGGGFWLWHLNRQLCQLHNWLRHQRIQALIIDRKHLYIGGHHHLHGTQVNHELQLQWTP